MIYEITLTDLPKVSLNQFYAGGHWSKRKKLKDKYYWLVRSQVERKFDKPCTVKYDFFFTKDVLDVSNCSGMLKMIEDVLFPDDSYKIVKGISITSNKAKENKVIITIKPEE